MADRCTVLRKGRYIGTVDVASTTKEEMSEMMVGRKVNLNVDVYKRQACSFPQAWARIPSRAAHSLF